MSIPVLKFGDDKLSRRDLVVSRARGVLQVLLLVVGGQQHTGTYTAAFGLPASFPQTCVLPLDRRGPDSTTLISSPG